jgi:exodeoxyribonuclease VII large subunit
MADSRVLGEGAVDHLVAALDSLCSCARDLDVIAVVRGGGARTELATFDGESLARAIATCPLPVVTGIGHETDDSIADRVAHASYKAPTACAAALCRRVSAYLDRVEARSGSVARAATRAGGRAEHRLHRAVSKLESRARIEISASQQRLAAAHRHVTARAPAILATERSLLGHAQARVAAADPSRALARGWSITRDERGKLVRSVDDAPEGTRLVTTVEHGTLLSIVEEAR